MTYLEITPKSTPSLDAQQCLEDVEAPKKGQKDEQ
jgi:hypothetical protein